jgi:hypothetical protein
MIEGTPRQEELVSGMIDVLTAKVPGIEHECLIGFAWMRQSKGIYFNAVSGDKCGIERLSL